MSWTDHIRGEGLEKEPELHELAPNLLGNDAHDLVRIDKDGELVLLPLTIVIIAVAKVALIVLGGQLKTEDLPFEDAFKNGNEAIHVRLHRNLDRGKVGGGRKRKILGVEEEGEE